MSILFYGKPDGKFSDLYVNARKKEHRLFTAEQVAKLPNLEKNHPHFGEWQLRKKSMHRFLSYVKNKRKPLRILDIGCGNGWFSNAISNVAQVHVTAIDVNIPELILAVSAFQKPNLVFAYADLFEDSAILEQRFDLIVFNSCFQYFNEAKQILAIAHRMLAENGEIHLIDSPFYKINEVGNARKRTQTYYDHLGFPEMAKYYFHHLFGDLGKYKILYKPGIINKLVKSDSPFCWILIEKHP